MEEVPKHIIYTMYPVQSLLTTFLCIKHITHLAYYKLKIKIILKINSLQNKFPIFSDLHSTNISLNALANTIISVHYTNKVKVRTADKDRKSVTNYSV